MKKSEIAKATNSSEPYVLMVLKSNRNPYTTKAMEIILEAANIHAEKCKAEFVADILRKWNFKQTIKNGKQKRI